MRLWEVRMSELIRTRKSDRPNLDQGRASCLPLLRLGVCLYLSQPFLFSLQRRAPSSQNTHSRPFLSIPLVSLLSQAVYSSTPDRVLEFSSLQPPLYG